MKRNFSSLQALRLARCVHENKCSETNFIDSSDRRLTLVKFSGRILIIMYIKYTKLDGRIKDFL